MHRPPRPGHHKRGRDSVKTKPVLTKRITARRGLCGSLEQAPPHGSRSTLAGRVQRFAPVWLVVIGAAVIAAGCRGEAKTESPNDPPPAVRIGAENVVTVKQDTIVVGPMISGELKPAREATVRAELGGSVLQVAVEAGQAVRRGALLGRIEAQTQEDVRQSAMSAVRSAENQAAVSPREAERTA